MRGFDKATNSSRLGTKMLDESRCLRSMLLLGLVRLVMRRGEKLERRGGISAPPRCARRQPTMWMEWKERWRSYCKTAGGAGCSQASFDMLYPLAALVIDSAYFQPEIQLSEVPISMGQSRNRRTSTFFFLRNT